MLIKALPNKVAMLNATPEQYYEMFLLLTNFFEKNYNNIFYGTLNLPHKPQFTLCLYHYWISKSVDLRDLEYFPPITFHKYSS